MNGMTGDRCTLYNEIKIKISAMFELEQKHENPYDSGLPIYSMIIMNNKLINLDPFHVCVACL